MSVTPERRFLGIEATGLDDRGLLGLPGEGALKSGQVEAALEGHIGTIERHPLGESAEARRLIAQLELSADRLQAEIALSGRGPLHPAAARRAAARMRASMGEPSPQARSRAEVVAPQAIAKPGIGLAANDLTEFDRVALAVLVVSGGWNAVSAKRLATIADEYGISVADLEKVVLGLTEFLSTGAGMREAMGNVGDSARASFMTSPRLSRADAAEGAVERVFTRINDVLRDEVGGGTKASQLRLIMIFGAFALSWVLALGWLFFSGGSEEEAPANSPVAAVPDAPAATPEPVRGDVDANGQPVTPIAALAAPAKFPRPPGFLPSKTPAAVAEAASAAAVWVSDLEEATRALSAAKGRLDASAEANRAESLARNALSRAADAWPAAGGYRGDCVRAFGGFARVAQGADSLRKTMQLVPGSMSDLAQRTIPSWQREWRLAFGAGVLASVALDDSQSPEVASAAREELRQRSVPIPRGKVTDPFGEAVVAWLSAAMPRIAEQIVFGSSTLEDVARWNEGVLSAASSQRMKMGAYLAAIDAVLRAPGALDQAGPIVDTLAFFIRALDFSGRGAESEAVRTALSTWILDKNIPPTRIWVFTSLLDADLGIAWYGPDLVLATNADDASRATLAERVDAAFPRVTATAVGEAILVDEQQLANWKKALEKQQALPVANEVERLRNVASALALLRAARAFEKSDEKSEKAGFAAADELVSREPKDWLAPPGGTRPGLPATGIADGTFVNEWMSRRDVQSRLEAVQALRARTSAGDLGPQDARLAAVEALRGSQADVRAELGRVLSEKYANGREVLRAVLDALADGGGSEDGRMFVGAISGATVAGRDWVSEARRAILEKLYEIGDSPEHAMDSTCAEISSQGIALATAFGKSEGLVVSPTRPDRAIAAVCDALRAEAATRFLADPFPASINEIERQRTARRSLATSLAQRMAAESPSMVDYAAMLVASRQPALQSKLADVLANARRARASAETATEQVASDLQAVLAIFNEGIAPKATERSGE